MACGTGCGVRVTQVTITWSPSRTWVTSAPAWTTTPVASWPSSIGRGRVALAMPWSCEWQMPLENSLTATWSAPGSGSVSSSMISGPPATVWIAARVVMSAPFALPFGSGLRRVAGALRVVNVRATCARMARM